jgi:hypothetical protein
VSSVCTTISYRWGKAKAAYCLNFYEKPANLQHVLKRGDVATVARLAKAAHEDETALLCLALALTPVFRRLATTPRYESLDVDLQALLWLVVKNPLASPHRADDEIELRLRSRLKAMVEKERNRRELAPTDALPDAEDDTAPEIAAEAPGDLDLRLDMEATVERLPPGQRQLVIASAVFGFTDAEIASETGVGYAAAEKARQRATKRAQDSHGQPPKKRR